MFKKNVYVYILNIFIYALTYMNIIYTCKYHVTIFTIYAVCVCISLYIINRQHTHTYIM